jgi:hypothetical protein
MHETAAELEEFDPLPEHPLEPGRKRRHHPWSETFLVLAHGTAVQTDPRGPEAGGFDDYVRESYDFDWDAAHSDAPYARIEAKTLLAFKRR